MAEAYLIVAALGSLILWTCAAAGSGWYARGRAEKAEVELRDQRIAGLETENTHLDHLLEAAAKGEADGVEHLRRRLAAAGVDDPSERRRLLYPEFEHGEDLAVPPGERA